MANVLVQESSLQDIADAIRAKNGTQNTYKPAQMADAIEAISGGGITPTGTINITTNGTHDVTNYASANVNVPTGSSATLGTKSITVNGTYSAEDDSLDGYSSVTVNVTDFLPVFINREQLGNYTFTGSSFVDQCFRESKFNSLSLPNLVTSQKDYMFFGATIGTLNLPALTLCRNNYFERLTISSLSLPELVTCGGSAFVQCSANTLNLPKFVNCTGQTAFKNMTNLTAINLPLCTTPGNYSFEGCTSLQTVDFGVLATIPQGLFNKCTALDNLILRKSTMVTLTNVNAFANMNGKAVTVYVPSTLVSSYESDGTWSSVTTATLTFAAIEGSVYES